MPSYSSRERDKDRRDKDKERYSRERDRKDRHRERDSKKDKKRKERDHDNREDKEAELKKKKRLEALEAWKKENAPMLEEERLKKEQEDKERMELEKIEQEKMELLKKQQEERDREQREAQQIIDEEKRKKMEEEMAIAIEQRKAKEAVLEDDIDPLDAFMAGLEPELKNPKVIARAQVLESDDEGDAPMDLEEQVVAKKYRKREILEADKSGIVYEPFEKDLYVEVPELKNMSIEEVAEYRKELDDLKIRGKNCPRPIKKFSQCGLGSQIIRVMEKNKFETPTPIQAQAIPAAMIGRDVIGIAKTGSGKTLAFVLPMIRQLLNRPPLEAGDGPLAIIMAPTRELAVQITSDTKKFAKSVGMRVCCCYGGASISDQISQLKRGAEIVVCTPGRMIDILCANNGKVTNLQRVSMVVLDEADRMFDLGFEPQIMAIMNNIRPDRQVLMFSATFPLKVEKAARQIMQKPLEILAGERNTVCDAITQHVEVKNGEERFIRLLQLLNEYYAAGSVLVFVDRHETADQLFIKLIRAGYDCLVLHGGINQKDRTDTIQQFKDGDKSLLVATSIASRGLDVKELNLVVNYDVPNHIEDYIHRIGRTGRAGRTGIAYTFIQQDEEQYSLDLIRVLEQACADVSEDLRKMGEEYSRKKAAGQEVKAKVDGYVTKGFKFDETEVAKEQEKKKLQRLSYGIVEGDEEEEEAKLLAATKIEEEIKKHAEREAASVAKEHPPQTTQKSSLQKAMEFVNKINSERAHDPDALWEEIEINDYPQHARWKVTYKDSISRVSEWTGCSVSCKGVYVPPGKNPPLGERRLHLVVEGPTRVAIESAKIEIKGMLQEALTEMPSQPYVQPTTRYSVL